MDRESEIECVQLPAAAMDDEASELGKRKAGEWRVKLGGGGGGVGMLLVVGGALAAVAFTARALKGGPPTDVHGEPKEESTNRQERPTSSSRSTRSIPDGVIEQTGAEEERDQGVADVSHRSEPLPVDLSSQPPTPAPPPSAPPLALLPAPPTPALLPPPPQPQAAESQQTHDAVQTQRNSTELGSSEGQAQGDDGSSPAPAQDVPPEDHQEGGGNHEEGEVNTPHDEDQGSDAEELGQESFSTSGIGNDDDSMESNTEPVWPEEATEESSSASPELGMKLRSDDSPFVRNGMEDIKGDSKTKMKTKTKTTEEKGMVVRNYKVFLQLASTLLALAALFLLVEHQDRVAETYQRLHQVLFPPATVPRN